MKQSKNERLKDFFIYLKENRIVRNQQDFTERLDTDKATISLILNGKTPLSNIMLDKLCGAFPILNKQWLLTGEGEMLKTEQEATEEKKDNVIPLLPVEAIAGYANGFAQSVELRDCRKIQSPVPGADYAIQISGDSMEPALKSGSIIYIKRINEKVFIPWGNIVVLDTENGAVVKEIYPCDDTEDFIIARSVNPKFPPYKIMTAGIYGIYKVLGSSFINSTL